MSELIRRPCIVKTFTPVVTASSAYSANNVVGTLFEIKNAVLDGSSFALVKSIVALSKSKADAPCLLILFSTQPAGTYTDKTAFNPSAADNLLITAICPFGGTWKDFGTASASGDKDLDILAQALADSTNAIPGTSTSLWGIITTTGTPTFGSTSDFTVKIALEQY